MTIQRLRGRALRHQRATVGATQARRLNCTCRRPVLQSAAQLCWLSTACNLSRQSLTSSCLVASSTRPRYRPAAARANASITALAARTTARRPSPCQVSPQHARTSYRVTPFRTFRRGRASTSAHSSRGRFRLAAETDPGTAMASTSAHARFIPHTCQSSV